MNFIQFIKEKFVKTRCYKGHVISNNYTVKAIGERITGLLINLTALYNIKEADKELSSMLSDINNKIPNCIKCKYYYVTWDPKSPRGCHIYGFKSQNIPSSVVTQSTGTHCIGFTEKQTTLKKDFSDKRFW